jgi:hypothetical protein
MDNIDKKVVEATEQPSFTTPAGTQQKMDPSINFNNSQPSMFLQQMSQAVPFNMMQAFPATLYQQMKNTGPNSNPTLPSTRRDDGDSKPKARTKASTRSSGKWGGQDAQCQKAKVKRLQTVMEQLLPTGNIEMEQLKNH